MINTLLLGMINSLFAVLTPEKVKAFISSAAEAVKSRIEETEEKWDDNLILPSINLVLAALEVPGPNGEYDVSGELKKLFYNLGQYVSLFLDAGLDKIEDLVVASETNIDDTVVLPLCTLIRTVLKIPDND